MTRAEKDKLRDNTLELKKLLGKYMEGSLRDESLAKINEILKLLKE